MFWNDNHIHMPGYFGELYGEFIKGIELTEAADIATIDKLELGRTESIKALELLRVHVYDNGFTSPQDEILFFKEIKPRFYRFFIYYLKIYDIETEKPPIGSEYTLNYLRVHIDELHRFNNDNASFLHYYRKKMTDRDDTYFRRQYLKNKYCLNPFSLEADPHFTTAKDYTISQFLAGQMIAEYIMGEIAFQNNIQQQRPNSNNNNDGLEWRGGAVDLVELAKSLELSGVFGNTPFNKILTQLGSDWNKPIQNGHVLLQDIGRRKKGICKFLSGAIQSMTTYYNNKE